MMWMVAHLVHASEDVTWFVLKTPTAIWNAQADSFGKIYPRYARPVQPPYGRDVLVSNHRRLIAGYERRPLHMVV